MIHEITKFRLISDELMNDIIWIIFIHIKQTEIAMEMLKTEGVELKPQPPYPVRVLYKNGQ